VEPTAVHRNTASIRPGGRGYRGGRCERCGLHVQFCVCPLLPTIANRMAVHVVVHWRESFKPSNTARLAVHMLTNCNLVVRGGPTPEAGRDVELALRSLDPDRTLLLYPDENAVPIEAIRDDGAGIDAVTSLVVPDGTWSQTRRLVRRHEALRKMRWVRLRAQDTQYVLRRGSESGLLCTLEAIAEALGILEGSTCKDGLMRGFATWQAQALKIRGRRGDAGPFAGRTNRGI